MKMIAAGYQDGNDANRLRSDPVFKMAQGVLPSGRDLASRSTMCRLENLPGVRELVAMGRAMVDLYCASFRQVPKRIVLDKHLRSPCPFRLNIGISSPPNLRARQLVCARLVRGRHQTRGTRPIASTHGSN